MEENVMSEPKVSCGTEEFHDTKPAGDQLVKRKTLIVDPRRVDPERYARSHKKPPPKKKPGKLKHKRRNPWFSELFSRSPAHQGPNIFAKHASGRKPSGQERPPIISLFHKYTWSTSQRFQQTDFLYSLFSLRDFALFSIYLTALLMANIGPYDYGYNFYGRMVADVFCTAPFHSAIGNNTVHSTFENMKRLDQIWDYIEAILIPAFETNPLGTKAPGMTVLRENVLVGSPRIRLLRVKNDTCKPVPLFKDTYKTCYDYYSSSTEEMVHTYPDRRWEAWLHTPHAGFLESYTPFSYMMGLGTDYGSGGFVLNITDDPNFTKRKLNILKRDNWIDPAARVIFFEFVLYTPHANLFCYTRLTVEHLPNGSLRTSHSILSMKLLRYLTAWDWIVFSSELAVFGFVIYYTVQWVIEYRLARSAYLGKFWNIYEIFLLMMSYIMIITGIIRSIGVWMTLRENIDLISTGDSANFDWIMNLCLTYERYSVLVFIMAWMKLIKFASLNGSVTYLLRSVARVKNELIVLLILGSSLTYGFAIWGLTIYGTQIPDFNSIGKSFTSLGYLVIGRSEFIKPCLRFMPLLSRFFLSLYIVIGSILYVNAYLAIIILGYDRAEHDMEEQSSRLYLGDLAYGLAIELFSYSRLFAAVAKLEADEFKSINCRDFDAFNSILKKRGCSGMELKALLKTHEIERGNLLKLPQLTTAYNDWLLRSQLKLEVESHDIIVHHFQNIEKSISTCDQTLMDILSKADILSDKMYKIPK